MKVGPLGTCSRRCWFVTGAVTEREVSRESVEKSPSPHLLYSAAVAAWWHQDKKTAMQSRIQCVGHTLIRHHQQAISYSSSQWHRPMKQRLIIIVFTQIRGHTPRIDVTDNAAWPSRWTSQFTVTLSRLLLLLLHISSAASQVTFYWMVKVLC